MSTKQEEHITSEDVMEYYRQHVPDFGVRRNGGIGITGVIDGIFDFDISANMEILKRLGQTTIEIGLDKNLDCKRVKPLVSLNADIPVKHSDEHKHDMLIFIDSQSDFDFKKWASSLSKE